MKCFHRGLFFSWNSISYSLQVLNGLIPSLIVLSMPRFLSLEDIGIFFSYVATVGLYQVFCEFGFTVSGIRECNLTRQKGVNPSFSVELLFDIGLIKILIGILTVLALVFASFFFHFSILIQLACLSTAFLASVTNVNWFLFSYSKSHIYAISIFIFRIPIFLLLFTAPLSPLGLAILWFSPQIFAGINSLIYILFVNYDYISWRPINIFSRLTETTLRTLRIFVTSSVTSSVALAWPILINNLISSEAAGVFGLADKLVRGLMMFVSPLQLFFLASKQSFGSEFALANWRSFLFLMFAFMIPHASVGFYGDYIVGVLFGIDDYPVDFIFMYMFIIYFLIFNMFAYVYLVRADLEVYHAVLYLTVLPFSLLTAELIGNIMYSPLFVELYVVLFLASIFFLLRLKRK
jgi:O-antigen/teichoic acid export membrane protein